MLRILFCTEIFSEWEFPVRNFVFFKESFLADYNLSRLGLNVRVSQGSVNRHLSSKK